MKFVLHSVLAAGLFIAPVAAFAGYGAIAIGTTDPSRWGVSYGWADLNQAEAQALAQCQSTGEPCYIYNTELNSCIYGPDSTWVCN